MESLCNAMKDWLRAQAAKFYEEEICKLVKCYDKCLNLNDNCFTYFKKLVKKSVKVASELRITSHQLLTKNKTEHKGDLRNNSKRNELIKDIILSARSKNLNYSNSNFGSFSLVGNSVKYEKRSSRKRQTKEKQYVPQLKPTIVENVQNIFKEVNDETTNKEEIKKHSGGVNKALISCKNKDKAAAKGQAKKRHSKKYRKFESYGAFRTPVTMNTTVFPNRELNFSGTNELPLFHDTAEAQTVITNILIQLYQNETNDLNHLMKKIYIEDENLEFNLINARSKSNNEMDSNQDVDKYLANVYDFLYQRHYKTLLDVISKNKPDKSDLRQLIPSSHRRSLHIHQDYFCQPQDNKYGIVQTTDRNEEESNDETSEISDTEDISLKESDCKTGIY